MTEQVYLGLWALVIACLGVAALLVILEIGHLPFMAENIQVDGYDTALSVKWMGEYGMFGNIPSFPAPYALFGNWPVLFALLGSLLNVIVNDASLSTLLLYWAIELTIAFLLWTRFLKNCDMPVKAAFIILFLFNIVFGNIFPFGYRKRQQLAILIGLLMFLTERLPLEILFGFGALLAQPFTGALLIILKAAHRLEKKNLVAAGALAIPIILAYPFYSNLLGFSQLQPEYSGCLFVTQSSYPIEQALFLLAAVLFYLHNRKKFGFLEAASLGMALFYFAALALFLLIKDFAPLDLTETFLQLVSFPCDSNFFNVAAVGIMLSVSLKNARIPKTAIAIILILAINTLFIASSAFLGVINTPAGGILHVLEADNITMVKGMELDVMYYGNSIRFKPAMTLFGLQGYALLEGKNLTFVDEFNMPPQLSKGGTNIPMAQLPEALYNHDFASCREMAGRMRSAGVQALIYGLDKDVTLPPDFNLGIFLDAPSLSECGLEMMSNSTSPTSIDVVYKIR